MKENKLIKAGQEVFVLQGRGHESAKVISKVIVTKVGRKYFQIDNAYSNCEYYLRINNGYFYNSEKHNGTSSYVFITKDEALLYQQGNSLKNRVSKVINNFSYNEVMEFLNKYEEE